jgi:hypothetical protein
MNEIENEHGKLVKRLAKPGCEIMKELHPNHAHIMHMCMLLSGECGELVDAIKKHVIYHKPLDFDNLSKKSITRQSLNFRN